MSSLHRRDIRTTGLPSDPKRWRPRLLAPLARRHHPYLLELSSRHVDRAHTCGGGSFLDGRIAHWHGELPVFYCGSINCLPIIECRSTRKLRAPISRRRIAAANCDGGFDQSVARAPPLFERLPRTLIVTSHDYIYSITASATPANAQKNGQRVAASDFKKKEPQGQPRGP